MLRAARAAADISLRELASRVRCSPSHLSRLENGDHRYASPDLLTRVAEVLDLDHDAVFIASGRIPHDLMAWISTTPNALTRIRRMQGRAA
jgi:transcriptional regulator with XRE-family HTH domain